MFKSKHSGWTWELRRTPFGGGSSWSPADPFRGAGDALASIDPGPAIGSAGASIDKTVNDNIPGGWITVGGLAAGGLALAYAPEVMALAAETGVEPAVASAQLGIPAVDVATGEAIPLATTTTAGADAILSAPDVAVNLGATGGGTVGSLNAALSAAGATGSGMSAALAPGTILGTGLEGGGAIGSSYAAGANGLPATDFFGNYIPASSINTGGVPSTVTGTGITSDTLNTLNNVKKGTDAANQLSKLLSQGAGSGLSNSLGKLAAGASPESLPNLIRGNQNPFTYTAQQPIQNAQPMDLSSLSKLLKQG
jgi:hypothetical protein